MPSINHSTAAILLVSGIPVIVLCAAGLIRRHSVRLWVDGYFASFEEQSTAHVSVAVACFCAPTIVVLFVVGALVGLIRTDPPAPPFLDVSAVGGYLFVGIVSLWLTATVGNQRAIDAYRALRNFFVICLCVFAGRSEIAGWAANALPYAEMPAPNNYAIEMLLKQASLPDVHVVASSLFPVETAGALSTFFSAPVMLIALGSENAHPTDELMAIAAHELGHIQNNDSNVALVYRLIAIGIMCFLSYWHAKRSSNVFSGAALAGRCFTGLFVAFSLVCGELFMSAVHERRADQFAVSLGHGPALEKALRQIASSKHPTFRSLIVHGQFEQRANRIEQLARLPP
jgi:Zn-dependent protease with chaperone function